MTYRLVNCGQNQDSFFFRVTQSNPHRSENAYMCINHHFSLTRAHTQKSKIPLVHLVYVSSSGALSSSASVTVMKLLMKCWS